MLIFRGVYGSIIFQSCNLVTKVDWTPFEMIRLNPVFLLLCGKVCYHMKTSLATRKLHNYKKPSSCFVFHRSLPSSATDHQGLEASCRLWWWAWSPPPTAGLRKKSDSHWNPGWNGAGMNHGVAFWSGTDGAVREKNLVQQYVCFLKICMSNAQSRYFEICGKVLKQWWFSYR